MSAARFPLIALHERLRGGETLDVSRSRQLAGELGLHESEVDAVASYYADFRATEQAVRVCRGASCRLADGAPLEAMLPAAAPRETAYCLGYCDRSPAALHPAGGVVLGDPFAAPPEDPPAIRCVAPRAIVTERLACGDHGGLARSRAAGVWGALAAALRGSPEAMLSTIERSGARGRHGAGTLTGRAWRECAATAADERLVVADGADPGSFVDRLLLERDPHAVLEGLAIAGFAVGARQGIVFVRGEYPRAIERVRAAIDEARAAGALGEHVLGSAFCFDVAVVPGMGRSTGSEGAVLNAIEGRRTRLRLRPAHASDGGLHGRPTLVEDVENLVVVPWILRNGAGAYAALGTPTSPGTKALSLNRGFARPGVLEIELGLTIRQVIEKACAGRGGERLAAVIVGGPTGRVLAPEDWDVPVCHDVMRARGLELGCGSLVAVPESADFASLLRHQVEYFRDESCGACAPCTLGSRRATLLVERRDVAARRELLALCETSAPTTACAFAEAMLRTIAALVERFADRIFTAGAR